MPPLQLAAALALLRPAAGCTSWLWTHSDEVWAPSSNVPTINGVVVNVTDGDTLDVLHEQRQIRIRLVEIDAPERSQAFGKRSTESLIELCANKMARVEWNNIDRYNRILGRVWCDGMDANKEQIRRGMAWSTTSTSPIAACTRSRKRQKPERSDFGLRKYSSRRGSGAE
jgi:endonuclease YncB( thermonuclease family)